ncbi:MAG: hypothetical protein QXG00_01155 [Candidatus Woesearchaeota archaeon]
MGLTYRKEDQLRKMPKIETSIKKSDDGKFLIHKTIITHIRPVQYYEAILDEIPKNKIKRKQRLLTKGYELAE